MAHMQGVVSSMTRIPKQSAVNTPIRMFGSVVYTASTFIMLVFLS